MKYLKQILIAIDQFFNALLGGWADETLSSRAWRQRNKKIRWFIAYSVIEFIFFWQKDHCKTAFYSERRSLHLPPELRCEDYP